MGVSRLTIRNVGAIATLLNKDTNCGFSSPSVLAAATMDGTVGGPGSLTLTVDNCEMDLGSETLVSENCTGGNTKASGKVTVSGTRTVSGTLTGSATTPVVPGGPDAVTITLTSAKVDKFKVINSVSKNKLTMVSGALKATVMPRLAVAASNGACSISTPNTAFSGVEYTEEMAFEIESDNAIKGTVHALSLTAFNGSDGSRENEFKGTVELSSQVGMLPPNLRRSYDVPVAGDDDGLDPDYTADGFKADYACTPDLATPESYTCADLTPLLADGAARLTVKMFGTLASLTDKDTTCGFSSAAGQGSAVLAGNVGEQGTLTQTITNCALNFGTTDVTLPADCNGAATMVRGSVMVSGTKVVAGRLTGDASTPVIPMSDSPATITLTFDFTGATFRVGDNQGANALTANGGTLAGQLQPRVALASDTGACSVTAPIARFSTLTWAGTTLGVTSASGTFSLPVAASSLNAVNGTWDADSNQLSGTVTVGTDALTVPSDAMGLDPNFSQATFDAGWACSPNLITPVSHQCVFVAPLGQGVARLLPRTAGTVLSLINGNTTCGFSSAGPTATLPDAMNVGMDGQTLVQTIASGTPCEITLPADTLLSTDCNGVETRGGGTVRVSGTKSVTGFFTGDPAQPIVPTSRDPAVFALTMDFTDFLVTNSASTSRMTINSGSFTATMTPRTGLDTTSGACSISTPVLTFDAISIASATQVTLVSDGKTFILPVTASDLDAQNGTKGAVTNQLTGSISVDGADLTVPTPGATNQLDPDYVQATFDASFACTPNLLVAPDDATCNFRRALSAGVARLLVKNVGVATSILDKENTCGFASPGAGGTATVDPPPTMAGDAVTLTLSLTACGITPPASSVTCIPGLTTNAEGTYTATATKVVAGLYTGSSPPVAPVIRTASQFNLTNLTFSGFAAFDFGAPVVEVQKLNISGVVTATVNPVAAYSGSDFGMSPIYSVSTPVAAFTSITATNVTAMLQSGAKYFRVLIDASDLTAFNGSYDATMQTNELSGSITLDGEQFMLAPGTALNPQYSQTTFDTGYSCSLADPSYVVPPYTP